MRYGAAACAYLVLAGWALLAGGILIVVGVTLLSMWGPEQWLSYFFIAAGWTLATTVAAGAARVLQRG